MISLASSTLHSILEMELGIGAASSEISSSEEKREREREKILWRPRITEQMFSPPLSLTAKQTMTNGDCREKLG